MHLKVLFVLLRHAYCINKLFGEEKLEEYDGYLKIKLLREAMCSKHHI